jgi:hypothetical protein
VATSVARDMFYSSRFTLLLVSTGGAPMEGHCLQRLGAASDSPPTYVYSALAAGPRQSLRVKEQFVDETIELSWPFSISWLTIFVEKILNPRNR